MSVPFYPYRLLHKDVNGQLWGLTGKGNRFLSWWEDTSGNPVIQNPDDNKLYYADWDSETHQFIQREPLYMESRKKALKRVYNPPSLDDVRFLASEHGADDDEEVRPTIKPVFVKLPDVEEKPDGQSIEATALKKTANIIDHFNRKADQNVGGELLFEETPLVPLNTALGSSMPLLSYASSGTLPSSLTCRNILLIYVRFNDSTGASLPDSTLLDMFNNPSQFGTVANFYDQNFSGKVKIRVINNKVYHVTLSTNAKKYNTQAESVFIDDVVVPSLQNVINDQGCGIASLPGTSYISPSEPLWGAEGNGVTYAFFSSWYLLDPATCLPVFIIHGQEAAMGYSSGVGIEANVWGHVMSMGETVGLDMNIGVGWDNTVSHVKSLTGSIWPFATTQPANGSNTAVSAWLTGDCEFMDVDPVEGVADKFIKPVMKYKLTKYATFGAYFQDAPLTIGITTHELGHGLFDLPDLYDIHFPSGSGNYLDDGSTSPTDPTATEDHINGYGIWSLMAMTHTSKTPDISTSAGSCPPNLSGYDLWYHNKKYCIPVTSSGDKVIDSPFRPHVIMCPDNPKELFILQPRIFTEYDAGIPPSVAKRVGTFVTYLDSNNEPTTTPTDVAVSSMGCAYIDNPGDFQPGLLIAHVNVDRSSVKYLGQLGLTSSSIKYKHMLTTIVEAHGKTEHLLVDYGLTRSYDWLGGSSASVNIGKYNVGDRKDLFGAATQTAFGQDTDPSNTYWFAQGKAKFNITNIAVDSSGKCTYHIEFLDTPPTDPGWDDLPDDPLRPDGFFVLPSPDGINPPSPEPEEPEEPSTSWLGDPHCWRNPALRVVIEDVPSTE